MISLYADECVHGQIVRGLRDLGVDVLTVVEDGREGDPDPLVLDRATALGRVLFSQDDDLLAEASRRQRQGLPFAGDIFAHQREIQIRRCIEDLALIASACEPEELQNRVEFLPLK